jgi:asparagine synthase (glutamine-hydrolysing)
MGFDQPDVDESEHARAVAQAIGSRHHEFQFDVNQFASLLPEVANALDEPVGDQAMLPVYWLAKEARKHVTVVLAGEGADEVFGGYGYYRAALAKTASRKTAGGLPAGLVSEEEAALQSGFPILSGFAERRQLILPSLPAEMDPWEAELSQWLETANSPLQKAAAADLTTWLADDLLVKFDRMAMAHSLEGRAPFLSPELLQAGLDLPDKSKMTKDTSKVLLRMAANDLLSPELLARRKQGFVLPMKSWLRQWFDMHGGPAGFFEQNEMLGLDPQVAARIAMVDMAQGLNRERLLFALVLIHQWWTGFAARRRALKSLIAAA